MKQRETQRRPQRTDTIKSHHIEQHRHDPYKASGKLAEPSACKECGAVFENGRWQWATSAPVGAHMLVCPACRRTEDNYPAGMMILSGDFVSDHSAEITRLARNTEAAERCEHPLQRIMELDTSDERIVITTTDIHLPRRIGHALVAAYNGDLETHYEDGYFVRMTWKRDT